MENDTAQQIEQRLAELPEDVRNAVMSVEWEQKVQAIAAKHALHIDQAGALGDTTLMAMLGFFSLAEYPSRIAQELNIPTEEASAIATEAGNEVFMPIRESLKKFNEAPVKTPQPAPAPVAAKPAPVIPPPAQTPKPDLSAAENMLQNKTVSVPTIKQEPPPSTSSGQAKPTNYTADPYREPPTP
jgi:hypothetical protein